MAKYLLQRTYKPKKLREAKKLGGGKLQSKPVLIRGKLASVLIRAHL